MTQVEADLATALMKSGEVSSSYRTGRSADPAAGPDAAATQTMTARATSAAAGMAFDLLMSDFPPSPKR